MAHRCDRRHRRAGLCTVIPAVLWIDRGNHGNRPQYARSDRPSSRKRPAGLRRVARETEEGRRARRCRPALPAAGRRRARGAILVAAATSHGHAARRATAARGAGPGTTTGSQRHPTKRSGARRRPSGRRVPTRRDGLADRRAGDRAGIAPQTCEQRVPADAAPWLQCARGRDPTPCERRSLNLGPVPAEGDLPGTTQSRLTGTAGAGQDRPLTGGDRLLLLVWPSTGPRSPQAG